MLGKVLKNGIFSMVGRIGTIMISFVLTPYLINQLGFEAFGLWSITQVLVTYLIMLDLGIGTALLKFLAQHRKSPEDFNQYFTTGTLGFLLFVVVVGLAVLPLSERIVEFFGVSPLLFDDGVLVIKLSVALFILTSITTILQAIINGLERMAISNGINLFVAFITAIVTFLIVHSGGGIVTIVAANVILLSLNVLLSALGARYVYPEVSLSLRHFKMEKLKQMLGFGGVMQYNSFCGLVNSQSDRFFIGKFTGLSNVTVYDMGFKLANLFKTLTVTMALGVTPASTALKDKKEQRRFFLRFSGVLFAFVFSVGLPLLVFGEHLLVIWLGQVPSESIMILKILIVTYGFSVVTAPGTLMARGIGELKYETAFASATLVLTVPLALIFGKQYDGLLGPVVGSSIAAVVGAIVFYIGYFRYMEFRTSVIARLFLLPASIAGVFYIILRYVSTEITVTKSLTTFLIVGITSVIAFGMYWMLLLLLRYFNEEDIRMLSSKLKHLLKRIKV